MGGKPNPGTPPDRRLKKNKKKQPKSTLLKKKAGTPNKIMQPK